VKTHKQLVQAGRLVGVKRGVTPPKIGAKLMLE
jgi:hypothetical protein